MKASKKSLALVAAAILLLIAGIAFFLLTRESRGTQVASADIPPPVVVQLAQSNGPLRVFPGPGGTLLILPDGSLWRWGRTGPGNWQRAKAPVQIGTNLDWKLASAPNNHCLALRTDGTLWEWGWRGYWPDGQERFSNEPEQVDPGTDWIDVSGGDVHSIALKRDGTLWGWGDNKQFQLGNGGGPNATNLIQIGTNQDWTAISSGDWNTLGLRKDGTLWLWGQVSWFAKGSAGANFMVPTQVNRDTNWIGLTAQGALLRGKTVELWNPLFSAPDAEAVISSIGNLRASNWISNRSALGWLGKPVFYEVRTNGTLWAAPVHITATSWNPPDKWRQVGKRSDWVSIWGFGTAVGLTADGTVWMWGADPGQEPIPDLGSRYKLWNAQVMRWLGKPPASLTTQATSPYQKEPRPLMRLEPTHK